MIQVKNSKFGLLEYGDIIKEGDEYYNNSIDKWLPIESEFLGQEFDIDYSKPVRRFLIDNQIKIVCEGGTIQFIVANFDCRIQVIDYDEEQPIFEPNKPDYLKTGQYIFE